MAYSAAWNEATPAGTIAATTLDDEIRNAKRDIRERVAGIFGLTLGEFSADPIVAKSLSLSDNLTVSGRLLLNTAVIADSAVGEAILANTKSVRGVTFNGLGTRNLVKLNTDNRVELSQDGTTVYLPLTTGGVLGIGTTTYTNASNADVVIANTKAIRSVNAANADTHSLIHMDSNDMVCLGGNGSGVNSGRPVRIQQLTNAGLPAAGATQDGRIIIDSTSGDLVFYKGSARYRLPGTGF